MQRRSAEPPGLGAASPPAAPTPPPGLGFDSSQRSSGSARRPGRGQRGSGPPRGGASRGGTPGRRERTPTPAPGPDQPCPAHLDAAQAETEIARGELFRAVLRCNPGDRSQAFCTVPGLPHDVFVRGGVAQNRSVEGDEVAIRLLPLHEWHRHDKNARAPAVAGAAPRGNVAAFGGAGRREMQRRMTPPVWSQTVPGTPGNDLIASPALYPSPSGGELAFALDAAAACDDEAGADADEAGASAAAAEVQRMELGGGSDTNHSMLSFLESTFRSPAAPRPSPAAPPPQPPQPAAPWAGAGDAKAAAAAVAALLQADWMGFRATAEVVAVLAPSPRRHNIVGVLLPAGGGGLLLDPCNPRMPQLRVPDRALPTPHAAQLLAESRRANAPRRTLVAASLVRWEPGEALPEGAVTEVVGEAGGLEAETRALLMQERVNDDDAFTPDVLACLPAAPWAVDEAEAARRRDFRRARVFSIDPPTARDLDDALSVEDLGGGGPGGERLLRIGVHIADVSHFVRPATALDEEANARSTSVYLVDRVIPMLPRPLCEELCSLNPGVDRLAFSVVWDMNEEGDIRSTWAGRSVIRSCAKLSYPAVQEMIEGRYAGDPGQGAPLGAAALHGPHAWADVVRDSLTLHRVAAALRRRRFQERGALRLDNVRLAFRLDPATGEPAGFEAYQQREANQLVEEFMLAANMTTARLISGAFPARALLRCHPPPSAHKMAELAAAVARLLPAAPPLDASSSGALHASLGALRAAAGSAAVGEVVTLLCTKPMQVARYFCTGDHEDAAAWRHYALAVGHYTHFTSPIRRYPDVLVHRLLAAAVDAGVLDWINAGGGGGGGGGDDGTPMAGAEAAAARAGHALPAAARVAHAAQHANDRKAAAKAVQDGCLRLYLASFLLQAPRVCEAVVLQLGGSRFFDVYVPCFGIDVRVHTEGLLRGGEAALFTSWDATAGTLVLDRSNRRGDPAYRGPKDEPCYDDIPNASAAANPDARRPAALPLSLRTLCTVTVLVGAQRSRTSGSPAGICAKLWVE